MHTPPPNRLGSAALLGWARLPYSPLGKYYSVCGQVCLQQTTDHQEMSVWKVWLWLGNGEERNIHGVVVLLQYGGMTQAPFLLCGTSYKSVSSRHYSLKSSPVSLGSGHCA